MIFDLGKVLIHFNFDIFYEILDYESKEKRLEEAIEPIILFESGKIPRIQFFEEMKKIYSFDLTLEKFEKIWCEVFFEIPEMIDLAKNIEDKYRIFIFSNTDEIHFPYIWETFPSLHFFGNNLMLSYELKAVKPELDSYKNALNKFNLNPEECVFIDDKSANIDVAEKLGMTGIVHESYKATKEKLKNILNMDL